MISSIKKYKKLSAFGNISIEEFLSDYWQKKPLFIPGAFKDFEAPISAEELGGLALEADIESRLIIETEAEKNWSLEHGPLEESRFTSLPENSWTLLIQHLDSISPEINALLDAFRFLPNWRIDDIMASYATDKGGVGPHFDYYDVFLLQASGTRQWKLGQVCDQNSALIPKQDMKILKDFFEEANYLAKPGDLLYVPAKIAHWGTAVGECMTYSIGFRAPSYSELMLELSQEIAQDLTEDQRYSDPSTSLPALHSGEIHPATIQALQNTFIKLSNDSHKFAQWLGKHSTQLNHNLEESFSFGQSCDINAPLRLSPNCRSAFYQDNNQATLFINGESYATNTKFAQRLTEGSEFHFSELNKEEQALVEVLFENELISNEIS